MILLILCSPGRIGSRPAARVKMCNVSHYMSVSKQDRRVHSILMLVAKAEAAQKRERQGHNVCNII